MNGKYITDFAEALGFALEDVEEIYKIYIQDAEKAVGKLEECLNTEDWENLERVVHSIKGASGNVNIKDVYEEAVIFDSKLKKEVIEGAAEHVDNIRKFVEESKKTIIDTFGE